MIDVVSPGGRSPGTALKLPVLARPSGAPQLEQYRELSGLGRPHRPQYIPAMAPSGLPSGDIVPPRTIPSGAVAKGTWGESCWSTRHANSRTRALLRVP